MLEETYLCQTKVENSFGFKERQEVISNNPQLIDSLRKQNFELKMRIFYLLEKLPQDQQIEYDNYIPLDSNEIEKELHAEKKKVVELEICFQEQVSVENRLDMELQNCVFVFNHIRLFLN
jgi:anion-transporting  ArsA/GET3 family ATPase